MKHFIILILTTTLIFSCTKKEKEEICDSGSPCTEELRYITVELTNNLGKTVYLEDSEYRTYRKSDNQTIDVPKQEHLSDKQYNTYNVFSDINYKETGCAGEKFIFEVKQNNTVVLQEEYLIGKDRCHIKLFEGRTKIQLN